MSIQEAVVIEPKTLLLYFENDSNTLLWKHFRFTELIYVAKIDVVTYIPWKFDVYLHFLGDRVKNKIMYIFDCTLYKITRLSSLWYRTSNQESLRSAVRSVRKHTFKLLRRYYKGSFITKQFKRLFQRLIDTVCSDLTTYLRIMAKKAGGLNKPSLLVH